VSTITGEIEIDVDAAHCHLAHVPRSTGSVLRSRFGTFEYEGCPTAVFDAGTW